MRNIFYRFSNAMARFMYGRNGSDQLNAALLAAYLVVCVVRILLARVSAAATVCDLLSMLLALAVIFYFPCKSCGAVCRVPAGKGHIEITCPKCGGKIIGKS